MMPRASKMSNHFEESDKHLRREKLIVKNE